MNRRRVFGLICLALLTWIVCDIYFMEMRKRSELALLCASAAALEGKAPKLLEPAPSARAAVEWIASVAGVSPNFEIFAGERVPSTAFAAFMDGRRVIVYDVNALRWGERVARWQEVGVIAHEVGHHLGSHIFIGGANAHANELEADSFAGYAAALLGASLAQALSFTDRLSEQESDSHPARDKRRVAVTEGWTRGEALRRSGGLGAAAHEGSAR